MRHFIAPELPDVAAAPAAPPAGQLNIFGQNGRPKARSSDGQVHDLSNIVRSAYVNGAEQTAVRIETRTFTTTTADFTLTFVQAFTGAPIVLVQPFTSFSDEPTHAEVLSVTATQAVIRTYRSTTHIHPLGASRGATQRQGAFCHAIILGVPA